MAFGFNPAEFGMPAPQRGPVMGANSAMMQTLRANREKMAAQRAVGPMMAAASQRFRTIGTPESSKVADLIDRDPRAANLYAKNFGGWENLERGMMSRRATRAVGAASTPEAGIQEALQLGEPAIARGASDLQTAEAQRGLIGAQEDYYRRRPAPGSRAGLTPNQEAGDAEIIDARQRLKAMEDRFGWGDKERREIAAQVTNPYRVQVMDDPNKEIAVKLLRDATDHRLGGGDPGFTRLRTRWWGGEPLDELEIAEREQAEFDADRKAAEDFFGGL